MTANDNTLAADGDLQFDRVAPAIPSVTCAKCSRAVTTYYYTVDDTSMCSSCKRALEAEWSRRKTGIWRAAGYGFGAAVAGAIVYYGVIAITNLEIGIVALLIGYMVGYAVRMGAGRGGRRRRSHNRARAVCLVRDRRLRRRRVRQTTTSRRAPLRREQRPWPATHDRLERERRIRHAN